MFKLKKEKETELILKIRKKREERKPDISEFIDGFKFYVRENPDTLRVEKIYCSREYEKRNFQLHTILEEELEEGKIFVYV